MNKETNLEEKPSTKMKIKAYVPEIRTIVLVMMGLMVAVQFILERVASIDTPVTRLSFTFVGRAVTGSILGPVYSALVGIAADLLGCFYKGYTINPVITFAAAFRGVTFGLCLFRKQTVVRMIVAAFLDQFVAGLVITTIGLFWLGGVPFAWQTVLARLVQSAVIFAVELAFLLLTRNNLFPQIKKFMSVMNESDSI